MKDKIISFLDRVFDSVWGLILGVALPGIVGLLIIVIGLCAEAQMPTGPDGPDDLPWILEEMGIEYVGFKYVDLDPNALHIENLTDTLNIYGNVQFCPFSLTLKFDIDIFKAYCDGVDWKDDMILIPTGCPFELKLVGKKHGHIHIMNCPVILKRKASLLKQSI